MTIKKRNQRQYDLVQQYLPGFILSIAFKIIKDLGDPCAVKLGLGGMTAYRSSVRPLSVSCLISDYLWGNTVSSSL